MRNETIAAVEQRATQGVLICYQCGRCSAGCPMRGYMEIPPHQVVRLLQLGLADEAMAHNTMWLCAACHTCASRCPRALDLSRVMEALRSVVLRAGRPRVEVNRIREECLATAPQQALVGGMRKYT